MQGVKQPHLHHSVSFITTTKTQDTKCSLYTPVKVFSVQNEIADDSAHVLGTCHSYVQCHQGLDLVCLLAFAAAALLAIPAATLLAEAAKLLLAALCGFAATAAVDLEPAEAPDFPLETALATALRPPFAASLEVACSCACTGVDPSGVCCGGAAFGRLVLLLALWAGSLACEGIATAAADPAAAAIGVVMGLLDNAAGGGPALMTVPAHEIMQAVSATAKHTKHEQPCTSPVHLDMNA